MPVVVMQGGGSHSTLPSKRIGPNSHLCISMFVMLLINPIFGFLAVVVSCCSMRSAEMDWEGARTRGKIALWLSIAGVVTTVIVVLVYVLVFFTRDS